VRIRKAIGANARELTLVLALAAILLGTNAMSGGAFFGAQNLINLMMETSIIMVGALAMMFVLVTGGIDLSIGSVMALTGMITGMAVRDLDIPAWAAFAMAIALGVGCGVVNGFLVAYLRIIPLIATLGTMYAYRGLTYVVNGSMWIRQVELNASFLAVSTTAFLGLRVHAWMAVLVAAGAAFFLNLTKTGRQIYAVGNSEESARVTGIPTKPILMLAYTILGGVAGLAGIMYGAKYALFQGASCNGFEMSAIASCVLGGVAVSGGVGKVKGVVLGAALLGLLNAALPQIGVSQFWQDAIRGAIILASILVNALTLRAAKTSLHRAKGGVPA